MEPKSIKNFDDGSPWLTTREAAAYLKLNPGTLRNYLRGGIIPHYIGPGTMTKRFLKSELDEWLKQGYQGPMRRLQQSKR
jgi:excisionase family DNA binding protein